MRPMIHEGYTPEEQLPGQSTYRTDKSKDGLPNDQDREKEINLPPGAATPSTPKKQDQPDGNGRDIKSPSYNGPGTGEPGPAEHPRTLPTPGEDSPTKFDYNMPTRRTMTAEQERVAYKPRIPWRRQKRQRVFKKLKDHRDYKRNKARVKQRLKLWYKKVKHNQNFRTRKEDRRDNPRKYKRRKVGDVEVECCGVMAKEAYTPWSLGQKRHRIRGPAHVHRHQSYVRDRARAHRQHHIWYQKNRNKPAFKRRQRMRRQNPSRFRLRLGGFVPAEEIWVIYGPKATLAVVDSVTDAIVAFTDAWTEDTHYLTPQAFMQAVTFLDEEGLHAMLDVLDEHGGANPYADPSLKDLLDVALLFGASADELLEEQVPLDEAVVDLAEDAMEEWDADPEVVRRVASAWLQATGEILLYDQRSPEDGKWEKPESLPSGSPVGPGQWTKSNPADGHEPSSGGMPDAEVGQPGGSGKVIPEHLKYAATIADIEAKLAREVVDRARGVKVRLSRADQKNGIWTFRASGSEGKTYTIWVKAEAKGTTKDVAKLQVKVSCDCDFFRFQGPEHWARANDYLYGKPRGTASAPTEKDAAGKHWLCKHAYKALSMARAYRVAGEGAWWPSMAEVVPEFESMSSRVAVRYGGA